MAGILELSRLPAYYGKQKPVISGPNDYRRGPVSVTTPKPGNNPLFEAMVETGVQAGYRAPTILAVTNRKAFGPMDHTT